MAAIRISVQAEPSDIHSWTALARRLESGGFDALVVGDHPGAGPSPWPALGAAAAVTTTLRLGTCVLQAGVRDPLQTAADAGSSSLSVVRALAVGA
jgi:alkanesulfonate monooxygenase SsuD/methylene tetrahydromethanopterin reductase-like flavin-dependent oxidoreductase (luciferase family)